MNKKDNRQQNKRQTLVFAVFSTVLYRVTLFATLVDDVHYNAVVTLPQGVACISNNAAFIRNL